MLIFDDHTNVYNPDVDEEVYEVDMYNIDQPTRRDNNEEEKLVNMFSRTSGMFISSMK